MYIEVAIAPFKNLFTYQLNYAEDPNQLTDDLTENLKGCLIEVPFGRRKVKGIIINTKTAINDNDKKYEIKIIKDYLPLPCFTAEQLELIEWISHYHRQIFSKVLLQVAPGKLKLNKQIQINLINDSVSTDELKGKNQKLIIQLLKENQNSLSYQNIKTKLNSSSLSSSLKKLIDKKIISKTEVVNSDLPVQNVQTDTLAIKLSNDQQKVAEECLTAINENKFKPYLLYGVTGSGKTEVYIELARTVLKQNKSVLILVPEIALTPQLINRFKKHLGQSIAILHSGITEKEKNQTWQALISQQLQVVIGVRSAIFAPLKNLGLIVVDEEHDTSYKQSDNFRYHARDLAVKRAQLNSCPVILGSATPALESVYNAKLNKYQLLKLTKRFGERPQAEIIKVDLNKLKKKDLASSNISKKLSEAIAQTLEQKEQIFLLYNRRGFTSYLQCKSCGESLHCPNCDITLTYHQHKDSLLCHMCDYQQKVPENCPECKVTNSENSVWTYCGSGTEKIDQEVKQLFQKANIARFDRDVIKSTNDYQRILDDFRAKKADILIGTQMIAKGHDIPNVTLVGVINCDVGLHLPDFRASEKCFQLLTQVAGRAGRGSTPGKVIFQTRQIKHPSLIHSSNKDLNAFIKQEIAQREILNYPPFCRLLRIIISSEKENFLQSKVNSFSQNLKQFITQQELDVKILGPSTTPIYKLRKHYRWHFIVKSQDLNSLHKIIDMFNFLADKNKQLRIVCDLDPQDML